MRPAPTPTSHAHTSVVLSDRERYVTDQVLLWLENDHHHSTQALTAVALGNAPMLRRYLSLVIHMARRGDAAWHVRQELAANNYDHVDWAALGAALHPITPPAQPRASFPSSSPPGEPMRAIPNLAMLLRHQEPYLTATIGVITDDDFCTPHALHEPAGVFYDFRIKGILDREYRHVWAIRPGYLTPYWIDLDRAEATVKLLRLLHRGLGELAAAPSPLDNTPGGFVTYLDRVAEILRIDRTYRATTPEERHTTGCRRRQVTSAQARAWVADLEIVHAKSR
jgi:hypothetical protein